MFYWYLIIVIIIAFFADETRTSGHCFIEKNPAFCNMIYS